LFCLRVARAEAWLIAKGRRMSFDLVIENGWIVDGISPSIYRGNIGISGDRIACIRPGFSLLPGKKVIDASEYCVAPGFINAHSHADHFLLLDPSMQYKLMQGITTEIGGNCGSSAYPWNRSHLFYIPDRQKDFVWNSFGGFLQAIEEKGIAINFGSQVGLDSLNGELNGEGSYSGSDSRLEAMKRLLEESLDEGATGLSMQSASATYLQSSQEDIAELCKIVAERDGILSAHLYSEASKIVVAVSDMLALAAYTGAALQISHFKTLDRLNWPRQDVVLKLIWTARSKGIDISMDCFPYTFCCSPLSVFLPPHISAHKTETDNRALNPAERKAVVEHLKEHFPKEESYRRVVCPHLESPKYGDLKNLDVLTMAAVLDREPSALILDLLEAEGPSRSVYYNCISTENMRAAIKMNCAMVASDPLPTGLSPYFENAVIHPRTFGAFQEYLSEFVYKHHIFTLPEAIKKITSAPAKRFGLKGRGVLSEGSFADITVFNPENVDSHVTLTDPRMPPSGVKHVVVNGRIVLEDGKFQNVHPGRALRRES
jgi:N-acyl-D-amino-acid deacylase